MVKRFVCKTNIRRFKSDPDLKTFIMNKIRRSKNGGINYTNYTNANFKIQTGKFRLLKSVQVSAGGFLFCDFDYLNRTTRKTKRNIHNFFYKHSEDGYFHNKFLLIDHVPASIELKGKGYVFYEVFLFLQEKYTREFLYPYFETLFDKMDTTIFSPTEEYYFKKIGSHKKLMED